jgi:hypothetical protein
MIILKNLLENSFFFSHKVKRLRRDKKMRSVEKLFFWGVTTCILSFSRTIAAEQISIKKEINYLEDFEFYGPGKVYISQGDKNEMILEGEKDIYYDTKLKVTRGKVQVIRKPRLFKKPASNFTCRLVVKDLYKIVLKGEVELNTEMLKLEDFQIDIAGKASAHLLIQGEDLIVHVVGQSQLTVEGQVDEQIILIEKAGIYRASNLKSQDCEIRILGQGEAEVKADNSLAVIILGDGEVSYTGEPKMLSQKISGKGKLSKK